MNKDWVNIINGYADEMRSNPTKSESLFAWILEYASEDENNIFDVNIPFKTQVPIQTKDKHYYIADFLIGDNLIIEIDGGYHRTKEQIKKDKQRTQKLNEVGYDVIRITDEELKGYVKIVKLSSNLGAYFHYQPNNSFLNWVVDGKEKKFEKYNSQLRTF